MQLKRVQLLFPFICFQSLSKIIIELGDTAEHGPLLLAWAAVVQLHSEAIANGSAANSGQILARKLGKRAVQLNTLEYLSSMLSVEPFNGKTVGICCVMSQQKLHHKVEEEDKYVVHNITHIRKLDDMQKKHLNCG